MACKHEHITKSSDWHYYHCDDCGWWFWVEPMSASPILCQQDDGLGKECGC